MENPHVSWYQQNCCERLVKPEELDDQAEDDKDVAITARFAERNVTRKLAPKKHRNQRTGKNGFGSAAD